MPGRPIVPWMLSQPLSCLLCKEPLVNPLGSLGKLSAAYCKLLSPDPGPPSSPRPLFQQVSLFTSASLKLLPFSFSDQASKIVLSYQTGPERTSQQPSESQ